MLSGVIKGVHSTVIYLRQKYFAFMKTFLLRDVSFPGTTGDQTESEKHLLRGGDTAEADKFIVMKPARNDRKVKSSFNQITKQKRLKGIKEEVDLAK